MRQHPFAWLFFSTAFAVPMMAVSAPGVGLRLPVLFERNTGESASAFPLLARGKGYALLLGRDRLQLRQPGAGSATIRFAGASPNVTV